MWVASATLLITLIVTRLIEAGYYNEQGRSQYKESTASFKCTEEGYHPDPRDCRIYYRCVDWGNGSPLTTFRFTCGIGTVFSKDKGDICTHPEDSGRPECAESDNVLDSDLRDPSESPTTAQMTVTAATRPQAITTQAPPTTRPFTSATKVTTTFQRPETTTQLSSTTNPPSTEQSDNNVSCQNGPGCTQEGFLADRCDCRRFYRCVDEGSGKFRKYNFTCGVGTVWDSEIQACNHAWAVVRKDCRQDSDSAGNGGDNNGSWNGDSDEQSNGDTDGSSQSGPPGQAGDSNSQQPDSPSYPGMPGTASSSDSSGYPGIPGSPEAQGVPASSGYPGPASTAPSYPTTLDSSGVSSSTGSPTTAGFPETSGYPASSEYPDNASGAQGLQPGLPDSSNNKPWTGICMEDGFFADPKDCRKFYRCVGEGTSFTKYEFQCGIGTAWDSSIQSCNHDYAVASCDRSNNMVVSEPDTSQNEIDGNNTSDANNPTSPQAAINCTVMSTSPKPDAQSPTHVTSATGSPVTPDQSTSISYLPPASSTYSPSTVRSTESVSYLPPATQTASASYLPPSSTAATGVQPESTMGSVSYSPGSGTPATVTSTLSSSPSQDGKSECTKEGFFPDPTDCRKFYRCVEGQSGYRKYEFQCGPGTAWDQSIQTCNHIGQVPCSTDSNEIDQGPDTSKPASPPPVTTETTSSSAYPPPTESVTVAGTPSEATTSESMSEADKTETSAATTADTISDGEKPASEKPEQVQTLPGTSSTEASSESSSEQSTSESSEVSSSSTESSEASSSSTESSESHAPDCTTRKPSGQIRCDNEGFYPHPTRCDKFYRCVDNGNGFNVYHFDCPPGTIFDPSISVCNYPESVYPARDCTTGDAGSSTSSDMPTTESTTRGTTAEQTEEVTSASTESVATTLSTEMTTSEVSEQTSGMSEASESTTESTTESTVAVTEAATDSSVSDQTTEVTSADSSTFSTESMESGTTMTESQESSVTESQEQSTTESQEQSTTESQEQSTTESQEQSTTESATPCSIGNLTDDQIILVCPTGFQRHPKHCNLFYQCTSEGNMEIKILVLSCPEDTIFDESKIQCLPEGSSSQPCAGTKANARFYRRLEDSALAPVKVSTNRLCPEEGHFPYRQDCSDIFYKCKRDIRDSLQGYLYKCPEDFVYWSVSRRCERATRLPMCSRSAYRNKTNRYDRWRIPTERLNLSARMLRLS